MKIYTKTGDDGKTSLIGGSRVPKNHLQIEAYGTIDELNSYLGLLRDELNDDFKKEVSFIIEVQRELFTIGSHLANDGQKSKIKLPDLNSELLTELEQSIDKMEESLEPMKFFVLPGGHKSVSVAHIVRTVCRRAERRIVEIPAINKKDEMIQFVNRLSDWAFVLSRYLTKHYNVEEKPWIWK